MTAKTERITFLGTPDFKAFLAAEAAKEGTSVSELIRNRCEYKHTSKDEEVLLAMVKEVHKATAKAKKSLEKGLADAEKELKKIPFLVRGKARRNTEIFAAERGVTQISLDTLYEAKAHYAR